PTQVRREEFRLAQVRRAQVRIAQVRLSYCRRAEVRPAQVRPAKVRTDLKVLVTPCTPGFHALLEHRDVPVVRHRSTPAWISPSPPRPPASPLAHPGSSS